MKKSLLNITVTMALSAAVFSGSVLSTQAYAGQAYTAQPVPDAPLADNTLITEHSSNENDTNETYMQPGIGIGAATGTLIAGPVGLVVGGLIGALVGSSVEANSTEDLTTDENKSMANSEISQNSAVADNKTEIIDNSSLTADSSKPDGLQFTQLASLNTVIENTEIEDSINSQHDDLIDVLTTDLSLDIYFRSGSTNIESFYPARLAAIADLMQTMHGMDVHLDGYTDRRGNQQQNSALASLRIKKVREQLISAGLDENRIISKAFGEMKMVSTVGDLETYNFDRKVVIRFERTSPDSLSSMATALADFSADETEISMNEENLLPVVAETPVIAETKALY